MVLAWCLQVFQKINLFFDIFGNLIQLCYYCYQIFKVLIFKDELAIFELQFCLEIWWWDVRVLFVLNKGTAGHTCCFLCAVLYTPSLCCNLVGMNDVRIICKFLCRQHLKPVAFTSVITANSTQEELQNSSVEVYKPSNASIVCEGVKWINIIGFVKLRHTVWTWL